MAIEARYTEQMPFVGTPTQKAILEQQARRPGWSRAAVIREAFDAFYGLEGGELPAGVTELPTGQVAQGGRSRRSVADVEAGRYVQRDPIDPDAEVSTSA